MGFFLLGALVGSAFVWWLYITARQEVVEVDEKRELLEEEKKIVLEFMHSLVEVIAEGGNRQELFQRIAHAAVLSSGALSACVYDVSEDGRLRAVAIEGLFPPQSTFETLDANESMVMTRAHFIEQVLDAEPIEMGEGIIGSAAQTREVIYVENALHDPRVMQ